MAWVGIFICDNITLLLDYVSETICLHIQNCKLVYLNECMQIVFFVLRKATVCFFNMIKNGFLLQFSLGNIKSDRGVVNAPFHKIWEFFSTLCRELFLYFDTLISDFASWKGGISVRNHLDLGERARFFAQIAGPFEKKFVLISTYSTWSLELDKFELDKFLQLYFIMSRIQAQVFGPNLALLYTWHFKNENFCYNIVLWNMCNLSNK